MEMLKSEQEKMDLSKVMMQSVEGCSMPSSSDYLSSLSSLSSSLRPHSPSPSSAIPQSMTDLLGGLVNPSQLLANNMDSSQVASLLEQMASLQSQLLTSQSLPFLSSHSVPTATPSKEAYCDMCDKTFCNRFFLRTHRLKKHGIDDGGSPVKMEERESPVEGAEGGRNSSVIRERSSVEGTSTDAREIKKEDERPMEVDGMTSSVSTSKCDECPFESDNFLALLQHKSLIHSSIHPEIVNTVTPPSSFACSECDSSFDSAALLTHHQALVHAQFGSLLNMFGAGDSSSFPAFLLNPQLPNPFSQLGNTPTVVKPPPAKRNYSSAGKNYCDVCNKEVCNKYFLRTHMLKMHGIVIDENKPVIANIDTRERERTGELTFRCDICSTTLSSRQQLRDHKQNSHGVSYPVGGTPSHNGGAMATPTRPVKPMSSLPSSTPSGMGGSLSFPPLPPSSSISSLDLSSLISADAAAALSSIDHTPPHTILTVGGAGANENMNGVGPMGGSMGVNGVKEESKTASIPPPPPSLGMAKCAHCVYTTRFSRNMEYHVERHERLNEMDRNGGEGGERMRMERGEGEKERNEEEELMRMTTDVALRMAKGNEETPSTTLLACTKCHRSFSTEAFLHSHTQLFHSNKMNKALNQLALKRKSAMKMQSKQLKASKGVKRRANGEKENEMSIQGGAERHSVTSGSISPLRSDLPEGVSSCDSGYSLQSLLVTTPLGLPLPPQFTASLPLSAPLLAPLTLTLTLTPMHS